MLHKITGDPMFGVAVTVAAYAGALWLHRRYSRLHPLFVCCCAVIGLLLVFDIPYEDYRKGGDIVAFFLGPATIALGVPLYKQAKALRRSLPAIAAGVAAGSISGMASVWVCVWSLSGSRELLLTMLPKSVTAPISIEIVRQLGGMPELGAVLTVLTGLIGSMFGPALLRAVGIRRDIPLGTAMGTAAHGIGTARVIRESELQGGASGLAMGLSGIVTSVMAIPLYVWLA